MPARPQPPRPNRWLVAAALGLLAPSPAATGPQRAAPPVVPPPAVAPAVVKGRVTDKNGAPLPGARVRVAIPGGDMRDAEEFHTDHLILEARAGVNGEYRLEVPGVVERTKASLDALAPGYRRLVGTFRQGGDPKDVEVEPGREVAADLALEPARYHAGTVVDRGGAPIAGVVVFATVRFPRSTGGIEQAITGPDGAFELFNYPPEPFRRAGEAGLGAVSFAHPDYIESRVDDVYAIDEAGRDRIRVVMDAGYRVAGRVLDEAGRPVADALVKAARADGSHRKGTRTDAEGRFALRGLSPGAATLDARALPIRQKLRLPLELDADRPDLEVRLRPIAFPKDVAAYDVLGMRLADLTPELQAAYDLPRPGGVMVLDPGADPGRLDIGPIAEGDELWLVGDHRVAGLRDFVDRIIAETRDLDLPEYSVRVVYNFSRTDLDGSSTSYLKLTRADLARLKALAARLQAEAR